MIESKNWREVVPVTGAHRVDVHLAHRVGVQQSGAAPGETLGAERDDQEVSDQARMAAVFPNRQVRGSRSIGTYRF